MTKGVKEDEAARQEAEAERFAGDYLNILDEQKQGLFEAMGTAVYSEKAITRETAKAIAEQHEAQTDLIKENYISTGTRWAKNITIKQNGPAEERIAETVEAERLILTETSLIEVSTANQITGVVSKALKEGLTIAQMQEAIIDAGIFGPARALRISRTITGSAASLGQLIAGEMSGATKKVWRDSGFNVRAAHQERDGETVGINDRFSVKLGSLVGPRWPGDPDVSASDRISCRCSLTFE